MRKKRKTKKWLITLLVFAVLLGVGYFAVSRGYDMFMRQMYPRSYAEIVEYEAQENGLDPAFVYAVIKTESNFDPNAKSSANALGLMQMTPETFAWIQSKYRGDPQYTADDLYTPEINIRYGCRLLAYLIDRYEFWDTALCAYNAGMGNANSWLQNAEYSTDGKTITNIPYPETRNYVSSVNRNYDTYRSLYDFSTTGGTQSGKEE